MESPGSLPAYLAAAALFLAAASPAADGEGRPPAGGSHRVALANGTEVVAIPRAGVPLLTSVAVVRSGASSGTGGTAGAAHMLEHLLFNGTTSRTQEALYADLDARGVIRNAHTGADETTLFMLAPGDQLASVLEIQADMLFRSTFPADKLEKERGIVLNEIARDQTQDTGRLDAFTAEVMYQGTPCAEPITGTAESIRALSRDAILAYHRLHYAPENVTLILMGDLDPGAALEAAKTTFGSVPRGGGHAAADDPQGAPAVPCRVATGAAGRTFSRHAEIDSRFVAMAAPAPALGDPLSHAAALLVRLVEPGLAEAAGKRLRSGRGEILDVSLFVAPQRSGGLLHATATLGAGLSYEEAARALGEEIRARMAAPADPAALAEKKNSERVRLALLEDRPHYYGLDRAPIVACCGWAGVQAAARDGDAVTPAEVARLAAGYADPSSWAVLYLGRDAPPVPPPPADAAPAAFPAGPGDAGHHAPESVETREVLPNGLVLRTRSSPGSSVFAVSLLARGRGAVEPAGKEGITDLLHRLAGNATARRDAATLERDLARIGASVKVTDDPRIPYDDGDTTPEFSFIRMETIEEFAEDALSILTEMIREPSLEGDAVERLRGMQIERARQAASRPAERARSLLLRSLLGDGAPLARPPFGSEGTLRSVSVRDLQAFRDAHFGPSNLIVAIAASIPSKQAYAMALRTLGTLRGDAGGAPARMEAPSAAARGSVRERSGAGQAYILMGALLRPHPSETAAIAAASAVLSRRMGMELRERRGLSYALGAGIEPLGDALLLTVRMGTTPAQVEAGLGGIQEMLDALHASPPDSAEVAAAVRSEGVRLMMRGLPRINQAFGLCLEEWRADSPLPTPWKDLAVPEAPAVAAAARKYFGGDTLTRVILE